MQVSVEGNRVDILFEYTTGQAAGQNMTTFSTNKIYQYILAHSPVTIIESSLEAGFAG
jgi:hydroxymethylglutaryl-CoA reductase (NADPH)